jgi:hypothetical protein
MGGGGDDRRGKERRWSEAKTSAGVVVLQYRPGDADVLRCDGEWAAKGSLEGHAALKRPSSCACDRVYGWKDFGSRDERYAKAGRKVSSPKISRAYGR